MTSVEIYAVLLLIGLANVHAMSIKRSERVPNNLDENVDESAYKVNYDVYPIVFPKRAAMLLDRLMVALHHALEDDDQKQIQKITEIYRAGQLPIPPPSNKQSMQPKYYKGKTDNDAYYGYKLVNGQTDESEDMEGKSMDHFGLRAGDYENEYGHSDDAMDLQRRGHSIGLESPNQGRVFWRCYFNAVTCF